MSDPKSPINNDGMDKQQYKNLLLFFVLLVGTYMIYDHLVVQPRIEALELASAEKQEELININQAKMAEYAEVIKDRNTVISEQKRIIINTKELSGSINLKGGRIDDVVLNSYYKTVDKLENVEYLSPANTTNPQYVEMGWISLSKTLKTPNNDTIWSVEGLNTKLSKDNPVTIYWENDQNLRFERIFVIDDNYLIKTTQRIINNSENEYILHPYSLISRHGIPPDLVGNMIMHEGPMGYVNKELHEYSYGDLRDDKEYIYTSKEGGWIGITDKYWFTGIIPPQDQEYKYRYTYTEGKELVYREKFQVDVTGPAYVISSKETKDVTNNFFIGAKKLDVIEKYETDLSIPHFDLVVDFGWLYFITKPFYYVITFLHGYVGNFGIAIICFTAILRLMVYPLASTSYRSFANMRKVTPQIIELRKLYGDDKVRLQQELLKLYQDEGVNPMSGCFPILIQIPIFFAMYKVLYVAIEMRHAPFYGWIQDLSAPDPTSILNLFGLLPYDAPDFFSIGIWPCLMLIGMLMQRQMNPPPQDPMQRHLMLFFPFFITWILAGFASGLVIYWTVSNFLSVLQQYVIMKSMGVPVHFFGRSKEEEKLDDMVKDGPDIHPAIAQAEEKIEDALIDDEPKEISPPKPKKKKKKK